VIPRLTSQAIDTAKTASSGSATAVSAVTAPFSLRGGTASPLLVLCLLAVPGRGDRVV
jgi:hypothetical protein